MISFNKNRGCYLPHVGYASGGLIRLLRLVTHNNYFRRKFATELYALMISQRQLNKHTGLIFSLKTPRDIVFIHLFRINNEDKE